MEPFSVVGLMIRGGKVLAVSRKTNHSDLGLPGGKVDPGETPEQALIREVGEEVGVKPLVFRQVFEDLDRVEGGEPRPCRTYEVESWEGEPVAKENAVVKWVRPSELLDSSHSFHRYNQRLFDHVGPIWE
jgi:mutator protein MutT